MDYEVIVVGGGIGGLTVAAVLAARGVNVCLLERQSQVGGCLATVEHAGYQFEPTFGLYTGWEPGGIYDRLAAELSTKAPRAGLSSNAYVVRLPDGNGIPRSFNHEEFESVLRSAFPESADAAVKFYRDLPRASPSDQSALAEHLEGFPPLFRAFIEIQLRALAQCSIAECSFRFAAELLDPRLSFWRVEGGLQAFVNMLLEAFTRHGGKLRLNSPALRLAFRSDGLPTGVDLLNGERIIATRAIVSNLTVWDTYGKLIGPGRIPRQISSVLKELHSAGVFQIFLSLSPRLASTLSPCPLLLVSPPGSDESPGSEWENLIFNANSWGANKATGVVSTFTPAEDWFLFHEDHAAFEARDQAMLEAVWTGLHTTMPELGDSLEVIETATPQTFYETLRRRFGMVGRPHTDGAQITHATPYPNLWIAGDTTAEGVGIAGVVESSWRLAQRIIN
jgi:phytoene dehydrogenase-like protein